MNMRYFLRRLSVVFVCLSVLFLNTFFAFASTDLVFSDENFGIDYSTYEQVDTSNGQYKVRWISQFGSLINDEFTSQGDIYAYTINSGSLNATYTTNIRNSSSSTNPMQKYFREQFVISTVGDVKLANKGSSLQILLDNVKMSMFATNSNGDIVRYSFFNPDSIALVKLLVYDENGNSQVIDKKSANFNVTANGLNVSFGADFENLPFDVYKANIIIYYYGDSAFNNNDGDPELTAKTWNWANITKGWGYDNSTLTISKDDNTSGLLSNIIEFIKSILDGVTNIFSKIGEFMTSVANSFSQLFTKLGNWFSSLIDSILQLPSKIWTLFENGLKALFVPDSEFVKDYKDSWNSVLEDRFGAIYQACDIVVEFVGNLDIAVSNNTIEIPSVSIDLPDDASFEFGGYQVQVVPTGFEFLANAVKLAVDIVCSFLVVNSLKRRFDCLLGDRL